jgi:DNA-directed RNA polymerase specialized sigma24 family protein
MRSEKNVSTGPAFCTTHWSVVLAAADRNSAEGEKALTELCQAYWYPLYAYVRCRGNSATEAEDLTQAFFERFLEKNPIKNVTPGIGRFRCFLLISLKHFLANEWHRAQTQKRGGGKVIFSLDECDSFEPAENLTPDVIFEQRWALTVLERVLGQLRSEFASTGKAELFDHLKAFLPLEHPEASYAEAAGRAGLKEGTVKVAVHRLRRRYAELLRAEIASTVSNPHEVGAEINYLISVLSSR